MTSWQYYPKSDVIPEYLLKVVNIFKQHAGAIDSSEHKLNSDGVLLVLKKSLLDIGFKVEKGNKLGDKISASPFWAK